MYPFCRVKIPILYEEAKQRHPREVAASVRALRASSSMHRGIAPSKIDWYYTIAVRPDTHAPLILTGLRPPPKPSKLPLEQEVQRTLSRSRAFLHAAVGRWSHHDGLSALPPEWEQHLRDELRKIQEARAAFEALPKKEQEFREEEAKTARWIRDNGKLPPK